MSDHKQRAYKELGLQQLRSFCEVCEQGGYAAAARKLLLTSPAVWEQMQALERHYGMRLLERAGHGIRPTAAGQQLLGMIRPLLANLDSARSMLSQDGGAMPAQLTLATNLRVLTDEVSQALKTFQKRYPTIRLHVLYTGNDVDQRIHQGEANVGFTLESGPAIPCSASVVYEAAGEVDYLLVAPPRHSVLRGKSLALKQIVEHPLVLGEPVAYSRRRVQEVLYRYGMLDDLRIAVETSSDEYTLSCVRAGLGIGITIGAGQGPLYAGIRARSLRRWFGTARVGFLWKKGAHVPPLERELAQAIAARLPKRARTARSVPLEKTE
jgi:DNA-binding transcriptional LysR family regulator